ncbi:MAG: 30S ribosomal protein S20 [Clostridia bacterium]|nr:30S ribosomal protein S20 [Clostridia bacterium]
MANIKSAKKRILVTEKKTLENKMIKSALKTQIKKFLAAVNAGDKALAEQLYPVTVSAIDSAASKGILHKNNAANKKAKLAKKLAAVAA